jgi:hypothetical protein
MRTRHGRKEAQTGFREGAFVAQRSMLTNERPLCSMTPWCSWFTSAFHHGLKGIFVWKKETPSGSDNEQA